MREGLGIDEPADQQIGVDETIEPDDGTHPVVLIAGEDDDPALADAFEDGPRHQVEFQGQAELRARQHAPGAVRDQGLRQAACPGLGGQHPIEELRTARQQRGFAVEVVGHGQGIGADVLPMLVEIRLGHGAGRGQRRAHLFIEPRLDAEVEEGPREHRHHHGRDQSHEAEQQNEADVQARPGAAAPMRRPHSNEPLPDDDAEKEKHAASTRRRNRTVLASGTIGEVPVSVATVTSPDTTAAATSA